MSIQGPTPDNSQPAHWVDLAARIRAGDKEAVLQLGAIFEAGIRFFLRRALGQENLESRQSEVLSLIAKDLGETSIHNPSQLTSRIVAVLRQYIGSQITASAHLVSRNESRVDIHVDAAKNLLSKLATVDSRALYRYYVDKETEEQICRALNIPAARFRALKNTTRTAVIARLRESTRQSERS
jgi:hypothetical protein